LFRGPYGTYSYTVLAIFALMLNVMVHILTTSLQRDKR
jgi:hypothetical protein